MKCVKKRKRFVLHCISEFRANLITVSAITWVWVCVIVICWWWLAVGFFFAPKKKNSNFCYFIHTVRLQVCPLIFIDLNKYRFSHIWLKIFPCITRNTFHRLLFLPFWRIYFSVCLLLAGPTTFTYVVKFYEDLNHISCIFTFATCVVPYNWNSCLVANDLNVTWKIHVHYIEALHFRKL